MISMQSNLLAIARPRYSLQATPHLKTTINECEEQSFVTHQIWKLRKSLNNTTIMNLKTTIYIAMGMTTDMTLRLTIDMTIGMARDITM